MGRHKRKSIITSDNTNCVLSFVENEAGQFAAADLFVASVRFDDTAFGGKTLPKFLDVF